MVVCNCQLDLESPNRFIQYELWKDCKNGCTFCFNKGQPDVNKIESLNYTIEKLNDEEVDLYNEIGFIGGEFFDTQLDNDEVRRLFYHLFDICKVKIEEGKVKKLYVTTALLYDIEKHLVPFLQYLRLNGLIDKTLLCTSWDVMGRFHTDGLKKLWEDNMLDLHKRFPELLIHTETIVTQAFINSVLEDKFSITDFCKTFDTRMDFIEPGSGFYYYDKKECAEHLKDFFPTKETFIKFLVKTYGNNEIDLNTFLSADIRSDVIYNILDGKRVSAHGRRKSSNDCFWKELKVKYDRGFIDSNDKMTDVVKAFKESIDG